jgi:predicted GNAT family N-acyltransferase
MAGPAQIRRVTGDEEIETAMAVRRRVFVDEQHGPPEEEPDALDAGAQHYLMESEGQVAGAARLVAADDGLIWLGRICLLPEARGRGWGKALVAYLVEEARGLGAREVALHAQAWAVPFYEGLGFRAEGELFEEAGIPHRRMRRRLNDE